MSYASDDPIEKLIRDGRHAAAAEAARAAGDPGRAAAIYAQIWDFGRAAACALEANDRLATIGYLCEAGKTIEAAELAERAPAEQALAAAEVLARKKVLEPAARIFERLGEMGRAAELFQRAGQSVAAALLLEKLGKLHEAGRLLERIADSLGEQGGAGAGPAHLALGRILARLGQHDAAAQHLQQAARDGASRAEAGRLLVGELLALGLPQAAADALASARAADPALPLTVEELVAAGAASAGAPAAGPAAALVGGRYRPIRLLGGSAIGRVYLARDEVTGGEVAVKLFTAPAQHGQPGYERFLREAQVWRRADHPNIVRLIDFREDLGYLAMEFLAGGTLEVRVAGGKPLPAATVKRIALDVLAALGHAHERGVVHRDVKPANIFFDGHGGAKLGDFGVAHLSDLGQTQTGALIGTLAYMSPEQITGAPVDAAADLYALGVTLFQAVTGRLPFLGPDYIAQHLGDAPPVPSGIEPAARPWDDLLGALLRKDPGARPSSAGEMMDAVRRLGRGERRAYLLPRATDPTPSAPPPEAPATAAPAAPASTERYTAEVPLGETACSTLARALDTVLERTVVLERFAPGHPDAPTLARLLKLAAAPTPYVQRVLAYDRTARAAVFEAPVGEPPGAAPPARFRDELGRALAAIHEQGAVHGALADKVLFDEEAGVTVLVAGLGPARDGVTREDDLAEAARLGG